MVTGEYFEGIGQLCFGAQVCKDKLWEILNNYVCSIIMWQCAVQC